MTVLVTGFGPFPGTPHNPTAALALAVDGSRIGAIGVRAAVLPVSYRRGPDEAITYARALGASLVLGFGVASRRDRVWVERTGVRVDSGPPDIDGRTDTGLEGPERVAATADVAVLAQVLGAGISDDAGVYVCNAWLHRVVRGVGVPVGFVHVPPVGIEPATVLDAIRALIR